MSKAQSPTPGPSPVGRGIVCLVNLQVKAARHEGAEAHKAQGNRLEGKD